MNEFWALVLGSCLGIVGGIIGTIFNEYIKTKNEKINTKKEVYFKMLETLNTLKLVDKVNGNDFQVKNCEMYTLARLYASLEVKKLFDNVQQFIKENEKDIDKDTSTKNMFDALIECLAAQMRKELGTLDKPSKKLLKLIEKPKKKRSNKNGN